MVRPRLLCLWLALITLLLYLPVWQHGFVGYDDPDYVTENRVVQGGLTWRGVEWAFTTFHASNWHPLTWLSHMLDCEVFGLDAGAQHLVNLLFHVANAVLLFILLLRLTNAMWPAAFVAALFAWHPLHVESVAWIAERKDVLSTFLGLLTLLAYERYARQAVDRSQSESSSKRLTAYGLTLLLFALGLMAKPMLVTLPFVMLLLDYWPLQRMSLPALDRSRRREEADSTEQRNRPPPHVGGYGGTPGTSGSAPEPAIAANYFVRLCLEKVPFLALSVASCMVTFLAQKAQAVVSLEQLPVSFRLGNAALAYAKYLLKTVWPIDLAVFYPTPVHLPWMQVAGAVLCLAIISWCVWRARREQPYLLTGWLWFLGTLVPVIGLVQVGKQAMADRYTYLPLIGIFIIVAYGVRDLTSHFRWKSGFIGTAATGALAGCLLVTYHQLQFWQNSVTLFTRTLAVTRNNAVAQINLGVALEKLNRKAEAMAHYREAVRLDPRSAEAHMDLANLLDAAGKTDEATAHFQEALRLEPNSLQVRCNVGAHLTRMDQFDEAMQQFAVAARLAPDDPRPLYLMGKARLRQGHSAEAVAHFRAALKLDPNDVHTLTFLARTLATAEDPQVRNGAQAVALAEKANILTGGQQPFVLDTLAAAYAEVGRFADAQQTLQKAIQLTSKTGEADVVSAMQQRLKLYESGRPYREASTNALSELD